MFALRRGLAQHPTSYQALVYGCILRKTTGKLLLLTQVVATAKACKGCATSSVLSQYLVNKNKPVPAEPVPAVLQEPKKKPP